MKKTLLLLFFVATLCSQSAMDAVSILMTVVFLASIFREGRAQWLKSFKALAMGNEKWFLGFLVSLTVSFVFFAPNLDHFVFRLLELKWYLFIYVLIWFFRDLTLTTREKKIVFSLLLVSSLWAVLIWFLKFDPIHPQDEMSPWAGGIRTGGLLGNSMTFAHLYGIYFCVLTVFLFYRRFSGERGLKLEWATFVSLGAALILSFTRGVWIALIVAFLFFIFAAFKNRATLRNQLALAIFIVAATVVGVLPGVRERIVRGIESGDERSLIWRGHFEIFKSHPVFGVGYGENTFLLPEVFEKWNVPKAQMISHAHNQYLHIAAGLGLVGLFFYLGLLGSFLVRVGGALNDDSLSLTRRAFLWGLWSAQIFFFVGGLTESNFEHAKIKYAMSVIWALSICLTSPRKKGVAA